MRTPQHPSQPFAQITAIVVLTLAVAACINPFSSADRDSSVDGSSRFGRLELRLAEEGIGAQTVLPGPVTPDAYDVILTRDGFDDVAVLGVASTTVTVPGLEVGEWSLVVTAFIAGQSVMRTAPDLTVEIQTGVNTFPVQLLPISEGTGSILVTVSWPAGLVNGFDAGSSSISDLLGGPPAPITGDVSITGNTLTYENAAIGAGFFQLRIVLTNNGVVVATVFEIVHVYQNLQSTKTIALTAAQISAPPAAPESLFLEQVSPTIVRLTWNDASNTETGFRVFRDGTPVTDLPAGSQTYDDTGFTAGANTLYEVRSFNTFGESSPLSVGPVIPIGAVTLAAPAISATSVPTRPLFEWSGGDGATAFDLYVEDQSANIVFQQFGIAGSSYQTTLAQQLTRDTTYNWYVVPRNATLTQIPAGGSQPFTVRGPLLFVGPGGVDDLQRGAAPALRYATVTYALQQALNGDEIRIAASPGGTTYQGPFTVNRDTTLSGNWNEAFTVQSAANTETRLTSDTQTTVTINGGPTVNLRNLEITNELDGTLAANTVWVVDGQLIVETARLRVESLTTGTARAILMSGDSNLTVQGSEIWAGIAGSPGSRAGIEAASTYRGTMVIGGPDPGDGNVFRASFSGATSAMIRVNQDTGDDAPTITILGNEFEQLTNSGGQFVHTVRLDNRNAMVLVRDNRITGGSNTGMGEVVGIRVQVGSGNAMVARNTVQMGNNLDSLNIGIQIAGAAGGTVLVDANRIALPLTEVADMWNFGIATTRPARISNNVIEQSGVAASTLGFRGIDVFSPNVEVIHNTIVNRNPNNANANLIAVGADFGTGFTAANNLLWAEGSITGGIRVNGTAQPQVIWNNSFFGLQALPFFFVNGLSVNDLNGQPFGAGNTEVNPFIALNEAIDSDQWYSFTVNSPNDVTAGGTIEFVPIVDTDILGVQREGPVVSIGAYENN